MVGGGIEPFPTIFLLVSGRNKTMRARPEMVAIARNQNTHAHPAAYVNAPPSTGPRLGPIVILLCYQLTELNVSKRRKDRWRTEKIRHSCESLCLLARRCH